MVYKNGHFYYANLPFIIKDVWAHPKYIILVFLNSPTVNLPPNPHISLILSSLYLDLFPFLEDL